MADEKKKGFDPRATVAEAWLIADSIDGSGQPARAGKRIAPNVEHWSESRVKAHVLHGKASLVKPKLNEDGDMVPHEKKAK